MKTAVFHFALQSPYPPLTVLAFAAILAVGSCGAHEAAIKETRHLVGQYDAKECHADLGQKKIEVFCERGD